MVLIGSEATRPHSLAFSVILMEYVYKALRQGERRPDWGVFIQAGMLIGVRQARKHLLFKERVGCISQIASSNSCFQRELKLVIQDSGETARK